MDSRLLKLSEQIMVRIPPSKKLNLLSNLKWVIGNMKLSNSELAESLQLLKEMKK